MQYFAGKEIIAGKGYHGWTSHFWPPLFSIFIGFASLVLPGFLAGKIISIVSAAALLYVAYHLAVHLFGEKKISLWTQVFLATNPVFVYETLQAHNHILDSLFFCSGILFFVLGLRQPSAGRFLLAGLAGGLAGLTRYQSYVIVLLPLALFFVVGLKRAIAFSLLFWAGFVVILSPWWYFNAKANGSPFFTWNYLNVCVGALRPNEYGLSLHALWRYYGMPEIHGLGDIFFRYPKGYIRNFLGNIPLSFEAASRGSLVLFVIPAMLDMLIRLKPRFSLTLLGLFAVSLAVVSQAYVASWYLLSWNILLTVLAAGFVLRYLDKLNSLYSALSKYRFRDLCLFVLVLVNLFLAALEIRSYVREKELYYPLWRAEEVAKAIKDHDQDVKEKVVMAIDPGRAYYVGARYLSTPGEYSGSIEGLVQYEGISERMRRYAPKYPAKMPLSELKADYLIYTNPKGIALWRLHELQQFAFLLDPKSKEIPSNFKLIYQSSDVVVYEIDWK